jgi:pilus assembly protein CpaB
VELSDVQKEADSAGRKALLFGVFALALAGAFGYMLAKFGGATQDTQPVVVAARALPPLTTLKAADLEVVAWPLTALPEGTVRDPNQILSPVKINIGELIKNEPILLPRITDADSGLAVSTLIEPEKRAYVVLVDELVATAQILHPGATVDVIATFKEQSKGTALVKTLLQNVKVLAVGDRVDVEPQATQFDENTDEGRRRAAQNPRDKQQRHRVVTLSVSLADVELLTFATRNGYLDLAMRSGSDTEIVTTQGVTNAKLFGALKKESEEEGDRQGSASTPSASPSMGGSRPSRSSGRRRSSPMIYHGR